MSEQLNQNPATTPSAADKAPGAAPSEPLEYAIQTEELWRIYLIGAHQEVPALRGINLAVESFTFAALKGRSGSGKTTLLNCLGGLDSPSRGSIRIFGQDIAQLKGEQLTRWRRKEIGFIFQSFGLLPTLSAYENVELALRISNRPGRELRERTMASLELVGLKKWIHHRPYEMSGGQQQRVAIARALVNQPKLILADEPTGELDSLTAREIFTLFQEITKEARVTLLVSSHDQLVDEYAHRVIQLRDGQVIS
jgi:putative ABC transport system ATP-binding protein